MTYDSLVALVVGIFYHQSMLNIMHNRQLFHPEVNIMWLIFSSTDYVFDLLIR